MSRSIVAPGLSAAMVMVTSCARATIGDSPMASAAPAAKMAFMSRPRGVSAGLFRRQGIGRLRAPQRVPEHVDLAGDRQPEAVLEPVEVGQPALHDDQRATSNGHDEQTGSLFG